MPPRKVLRRSHRKSRLGCQECKRRHIKCDEAQPTCENCTRDDGTCSYLQRLPDSFQRAVSSQSPYAPSEPASSRSFTAGSRSQGVPSAVEHSNTPSPAVVSSVDLSFLSPASSSPYGSDLSFSLRHMQLFSHFIFETLPSLKETGSIDNGQARALMPAVLSEPYTIYQLLALSAMHVSYQSPEEAIWHLEEARALQTQALCAFNNAYIEVTVDNCVSIMSFSTLIGLYNLADVAGNADVGAGGVLDAFITYMNLHRGVRAIISQSWRFLSQTSVAPLLEQTTSAIDHALSCNNRTAVAVADRLSNLLDHADMSEESRQVCSAAVSQLTVVYQTEQDVVKPSNQPPENGLLWVFPINLSSEFTALLSMCKPEALIILAHYAVLLHRRRRVWLVGNVGRILIEEISRFLGTFWRTYLDWPLAQSHGDT
ncbi:hypothetical protein HBH56_164390 [Parastagonospora nodorum]|uniref:Uncharacterized protein n=2 Tax=Phaeosphaeria nodorum (strain SN15 / ATCC MYA-4574 / FGSC 10173) TaxID=321614 RepID=Q0U8I1_PHANO|nr:hypothetical protein SNOG_11933 [Parastagonospora nodorum SN15]KAH3909414.1 hypothetical protein HBH56_164390 [Parastagonospora nodorum]EAT80977.1 hypothetical protein SNOG_11933 [Parastagonospora nodorum SN15]KAH3932177.1 hypothetical protein HBH54_084850 [Parastagonospora nodorum]KAH4095479.1 hypothetical protein HBH46_169500 [Parastagonospora nodorum]KAH4141063.1 hypothetical protein HBH45_073170 [Parastagonospora nodorum]